MGSEPSLASQQQAESRENNFFGGKIDALSDKWSAFVYFFFIIYLALIIFSGRRSTIDRGYPFFFFLASTCSALVFTPSFLSCLGVGTLLVTCHLWQTHAQGLFAHPSCFASPSTTETSIHRFGSSSSGMPLLEWRSRHDAKLSQIGHPSETYQDGSLKFATIWNWRPTYQQAKQSTRTKDTHRRAKDKPNATSWFFWSFYYYSKQQGFLGKGITKMGTIEGKESISSALTYRLRGGIFALLYFLAAFSRLFFSFPFSLSHSSLYANPLAY